MNILTSVTSTPRNVFLLDGIGALLSALLLVFLIAPFEHIFGVHPSVAYTLFIPAFCFALYSLSCYFLNINNWKLYLRLIAIANILYCGITLGLVLQQSHNLTTLGILYFLGEIVIILFIVGIELSTIKKHKM